jgi:hypothetical protein
VFEKAMTTVYRDMPFECEATIEGRTWMPQENTGFDLAEIEELADVE